MTASVDGRVDGRSGDPSNNCLERRVDIAIVGSGMIGATLALALAPLGLRIMLLDARAPVAPTLSDADFDNRVSALTHASQRLFEELGVWQAMQQLRVSPYTHMHVREADGTGQIDFDAREVHTETLGHIVENSVVSAALLQALHQQASIELKMPAKVVALHTLDDGGGQLTLDDDSQIQASLIVAADGAHSPLRALAGIRTREWDYGHEALVCTVTTTEPHGQTARQIFHDDGVLAFLPLPGATGPGAIGQDEHYCSIVWSVIPERAAQLRAMTDDEFCAALTRASEAWLGPVLSATARQGFALRQRHARDYFQGPLVLVGDAAHSIHPLAGQGANLGLLDAKVLAEEIRRAVRTGRPLHDRLVLTRYQRRRKPHNLGMMVAMEAFKVLYADQSLPLRWLRNTGMRGADRFSLLKQHILREALG